MTIDLPLVLITYPSSPMLLSAETPEVLAKFAHYNSEKPEEEPEFLVQHHLKATHHIEHWKKMYEEYERLKPESSFGPTLEHAIMIVVSLVLDGFFKEKLLEKASEFKPFMMSNVWIFTERICSFDYEGILRGEVK